MMDGWIGWVDLDFLGRVEDNMAQGISVCRFIRDIPRTLKYLTSFMTGVLDEMEGSQQF